MSVLAKRAIRRYMTSYPSFQRQFGVAESRMERAIDADLVILLEELRAIADLIATRDRRSARYGDVIERLVKATLELEPDR